MIKQNQTIIMNWNNSSKKYYESKGYKFTFNKDSFEVDLNDLNPKSDKKIKCICDYCLIEIEMPFCKAFNEDKHSCSKCRYLKIKENNLKKYGVTNTTKLKIVQDKIKQTNLEKYGVEHPLQVKEIKQKMEKTLLDRYGVKNPSQIEDVKEKKKQTSFNNYGVEHPMHNEKVIEKIQNTNLERYGVVCNLQASNSKDDIHFKRINTCLETFGVEYPLQSKEIQEKIRQSKYQNGTAPSSKQQRYLHNLLGGELNYPVGNCFLDIAFIDKKIYVEYDGSGHDASVNIYGYSREEFNKKEIDRQYFLKNKGWKLIRIISKKDLLPKDDDILDLISNANSYLLNSNRSWIEIDIDNSEIRCSNFNNQIKFSNLRKI